MGLLKKLLQVGATAGAAVAAVRVADRYQQNNPEGVKDVNGDGKVDAKDVAAEVKKAATEVYHETADAVKRKAPEVAQKAKDAANGVFGGKDANDGQNA